MARKSVIIELSQAVELHGQRVASVAVQEPTAARFLELGEPTVTVFLKDGGAYVVEQPSVVTRYCEECVMHDLGGDLLKIVAFADARRIKAAVLDFFRDAPSPKSAD